MDTQLSLTKDVKQHIQDHAEADYPFECCGFLYGSEKEKDERIITIARRVDNTKEENRRRRFEISPREYQQAELFADEQNLMLLGVYHSHPDHPAEPSEHDLKQAMPFFSYIITSVEDGKATTMTSWQLNDDGNFDEERISILKQNKIT